MPADPARREGGEPVHCTGVSAAWCPRCGSCTCDRAANMDNPDCPLHSEDSHHAERNPEPLSCPHDAAWKARLREAHEAVVAKVDDLGMVTTPTAKQLQELSVLCDAFERILNEGGEGE